MPTHPTTAPDRRALRSMVSAIRKSPVQASGMCPVELQQALPNGDCVGAGNFFRMPCDCDKEVRKVKIGRCPRIAVATEPCCCR